MFDEKNHDRTDSLGTRMTRLGEQMTPSPELMKAAATGTPLRSGIRYTAGTHVKQITKAILLYAACVAIFLGAIMLLPRWFDTQPPIATQPPISTKSPATTTTPPAPDRDTIENPEQYTDYEIELIKALWEREKARFSAETTIDIIAKEIHRCKIMPCIQQLAPRH